MKFWKPNEKYVKMNKNFVDQVGVGQVAVGQLSATS
jgi:hypothetical protein